MHPRPFAIINNAWKSLLKCFQRPLRKDIALFRGEYEQLVGRYEALLKQISTYMKKHSHILNGDSREPPEFWDQLNSVDSFLLQSIRDDLKGITRECELLLARGEEKPVNYPYQQKILNLHISQLKELRKYSAQIDSTLISFEQKLMRVEEVLSDRTLSN